MPTANMDFFLEMAKEKWIIFWFTTTRSPHLVGHSLGESISMIWGLEALSKINHFLEKAGSLAWMKVHLTWIIMKMTRDSAEKSMKATLCRLALSWKEMKM